jgi:hypothetical protein
MEPFSRYAFFTIARDASFVCLAGATLMVAFSFDPALALDIGGHVALLFAVILLGRALYLSEDRILRSEPWRGLEPDERPIGDSGVRWAFDQMETLLLRFAKLAAGIAGMLYGSSLVASIV